MPNDSNIPHPFDGDDDTDSLADELQGVSLNTPRSTRSASPTPTPTLESQSKSGPSNFSSSAHTNSALVAFFQSFEGPQRYVYNPANSPTDEFARLANVRGWGLKTLKKHKTKFDTIMAQPAASGPKHAYCEDATSTPIEDFFRSQERTGSGFTFKKGVHPGTQWANLRKARGFKGDDKSTAYQVLKAAWISAVEMDLNDLLPDDAINTWSWVCFILALITEEEYKAGITSTRAKKLVRKVFVNIYDFRDWARNGYRNGVAGLRTFPNKWELGRFIRNKKGRTFPLGVAKKDGKDGVARWLLHDVGLRMKVH